VIRKNEQKPNMEGRVMRRPAIKLAYLIGGVLLSSTAWAASPVEKAARELSTLTPDNVAARVSMRDDDLEASATFTTEPIYKERKGLLGNVPNDSFLRAFVDKRTGTVSWQVYVVTTYIGSWHFYEQANFQTSNGVETVSLTVIDRQVQGCISAADCVYSEQVGFTLTDEIARALARLYDPKGPLAIWRFRLKGKSGEDYTDGIAAAELSGLVKAVDNWRAAHQLVGIATRTAISSAASSAAPTLSAPASGQAPLGVQFVPTQYGAAIAAVLPGSRAAMAGITPGNIVSAVDNKPLAGLSMPEMQMVLAQAGRHTFAIMGKGDLVVQ
jgi:hypothetical protein